MRIMKMRAIMMDDGDNHRDEDNDDDGNHVDVDDHQHDDAKSSFVG